MQNKINNFIQSNKELSKVNALLEKFFYSPFYFILIFFIVAVFWSLHLDAWGIGILCGIIFIILATQDNILPISPLICAGPLLISAAQMNMSILFCFIPVVLGLVVYFVKNRFVLVIGKEFYSMLAVTVAVILAGAVYRVKCTDGYYQGVSYGGLIIGAIAIVFFILYVLFTSFSKQSKYMNTIEYFAWSMLVCAFAIMYQMFFIVVGLEGDIFSTLISGGKDMWIFGWGISNNAASVLGLCIPLTLYLGLKGRAQTFLFTFITLLEILFIFLTGSRGMILVVMLFTIPVYVYFLAVTSYRKEMLIITGLLLVISVILAIVYFEKITEIFDKIFKYGLESKSRVRLYKEGWALFKESPLFGVGFDYKFGYDYQGNYNNLIQAYYFHSTPVQIIASTGILGTIAYIYRYINRYAMFLHKGVEGMMLLWGNLLFEGYCLMDPNNFCVNQIMIILMGFVALELLDKSDENLIYKRKAETKNHFDLFKKNEKIQSE